MNCRRKYCDKQVSINMCANGYGDYCSSQCAREDNQAGILVPITSVEGLAERIASLEKRLQQLANEMAAVTDETLECGCFVVTRKDPFGVETKIKTLCEQHIKEEFASRTKQIEPYDRLDQPKLSAQSIELLNRLYRDDRLFAYKEQYVMITANDANAISDMAAEILALLKKLGAI